LLLVLEVVVEEGMPSPVEVALVHTFVVAVTWVVVEDTVAS
jgi:hypothetical protein